MTIKIHKGATPDDVKTILANRKNAQKGLRQFVGKLKRGFDGMAYQNEVRNEWN